MKPNLFALFKKRFQKIKEVEDNELRKASIEEKFQQLTSLIYMALGLRINIAKNRKTQMIHTNWALLKSGR